MGDAEKGKDDDKKEFNLLYADEYILTEIEKKFILACEHGDVSTVKRVIEENGDNKEFNINCVDPMNRSGLISAIENENYDLIVLLLSKGIGVGDALLHAISEEYVEGVEELLQWEETTHKEGEPYSWEAVDRSKSNFTPDITPLILAAHRNNYEILKMLLDRGATLPMPHDVKCGCDDCVGAQESDSLRYSQSRINAYRALSASSLIALSSRDPVLTSFELAFELKRLQAMESEFRLEYTEMRKGVQEFVSCLLDHARTSTELEVMLNYNHEPGNEVWFPGDRQTLERLKLAIKYKQKDFVAHPNVQQLLAAIWYDGLPGFRRKTTPQQIKDVLKLACMFPVYSMNYIMAPESEMGKFMKKPFVKFISHSASYMFFLMLLGAASLRVINFLLEFLAFPWMVEILDDLKKHERGSLPGPIELAIIFYISSLIFGELKSLYSDGILEYITDLWNVIDFISNMFYVTWILCRATSFIIVRRDLWYRNINPYFPREHWHPFDPMLLAEGAFAAGMIFSFLKLVHIFSINPHLGPLQVSLGRMIIDIIKFFFIYTLVLFAFACGFNQLLWYYADLEKHKCYHLHPEVPDFDDAEKACTVWRRFANLFETSQSLFWASFGLVDLVSFDLQGIKGFTRFWALLMFGSYSVINIIVLLNMLIAMMSNSYQIISDKSDVEWKFARSQLWMSYFEDGGTLPPPFNMCPTMKMVKALLGKNKKKRTKSFIRRTMEKAQGMHDKVMRLLVRRYVTAEQRNRHDFGITEDDIIEVRQDISTLRFELLDIFANNRFVVPNIEKKQISSGTKYGKILERQLQKDFQIGFVETLAQEMASNEENTMDVFGSIAKIVKHNRSVKGEKKDWNAIVRSNTIHSNPIGTKRSSIIRRQQLSLRRQLIDEANMGLDMDTSKVVEYNPKLEEQTVATRVAYVKFMQKTLEKREQESEGKEEEGDGGDEAKKRTASKRDPEKAKKDLSGTLKKITSSVKEKKKEDEPDPEPKEPPPLDAKPAKSALKTDSLKKEKAPAAPPKPDDKKPAPTQAADGKSDKKEESKDTKKEESKSEKKEESKEVKKDAPKEASTSGEAKPSDKKDDKKDDKKGDKKDEKKDDKKPAPAKPPEKPKVNKGAPPAGGDRGKSTVTGRVITGWL